MADNLNLDFDEIVVKRENPVAHGGVGALLTCELVLTNKKIICLHKGMFGGVKKTYIYPLEEVKIYNGVPQVKLGKLSNGMPCLDLYLKTGEEHFQFQAASISQSSKVVNVWINEIMRVFGVNGTHYSSSDELEDRYSVASAFKEVGEAYKEVGREFAAAFGFKPKDKKKPTSDYAEMISCTYCGKMIQRGTAFCSQCGNKVQSLNDTEKINNICSNCGKLLPVDLQFCTQCGTEVKRNNGFVKQIPQSENEEGNNDKEKLNINQQIELLEKLKSLVDAGVLSQEEFEKKKREILG